VSENDFEALVLRTQSKNVLFGVSTINTIGAQRFRLDQRTWADVA
jgi:hypothetical protein